MKDGQLWKQERFTAVFKSDVEKVTGMWNENNQSLVEDPAAKKRWQVSQGEYWLKSVLGFNQFFFILAPFCNQVWHPKWILGLTEALIKWS